MDPTAPPSLTDLYIKARTQGLDDTNAALAVAAHLRQMADARSGFREAGAIAAGRPYDATADRAQLMGEADRPLQELAARRAVPDVAMGEAKRVGELASADIGAQQAAQLRNPSHPTNVAARAALARVGIDAPPGLTVATMPKELWEQIKPLADLTGKGQEIAALAPGRAAEASKATAEAGQTRALTGPKAAQTTAEAEKAAAEAAVERQKVGGQVAPGWVRTGNIAGVGDKEIEEFRGQTGAAADTERVTGQLIDLLGNKDVVLDPKKRAKAAVLSGKLLGSMKSAMGIRGLPAQDVQYLQNLTGDITSVSPSTLLGLRNNAVRLRTLNSNVQAELESRAKALGLGRIGGSATAGNDDAQALEWAKAHPADPRAAKILKVASPKLAVAPGGVPAGGP